MHGIRDRKLEVVAAKWGRISQRGSLQLVTLQSIFTTPLHQELQKLLT